MEYRFIEGCQYLVVIIVFPKILLSFYPKPYMTTLLTTLAHDDPSVLETLKNTYGICCQLSTLFYTHLY